MDVLLLLFLAAAAVLSVRVFGRIDWAFVSGRGSTDVDRGAVDLWMPIVLIAPMVAAGGRVRGDVEAVAPLTVSLPVATAMLALGLSLLGVGRRTGHGPAGIDVPPATLAITSVTGVVFLLLSATGRMSIGVGQTAFAIAAVLLWLNAPDQTRTEGSDGNDERSGQPESVLALFGLAIVKIVAVAMIDTPWLPIAGGLLAVEAAMVIAIAVALGGAGVAARVGSWCGAYGVLLAMGVVSLVALMRSSLGLLASGRTDETLRLASNVAEGFGRFALEGVILAILPLVLLASRATLDRVARVGGAGLAIGGAILAAARLGGA